MKTLNIKLIDQSIKCLTKKSTYKDYLNDIENYARICFQSKGHIGLPFVKRLLVNQHESVLEHFNISFKIITDRAIANALVRHRHCAYTQESTHYIDYIKKSEVIEIIKPCHIKNKSEVDYFRSAVSSSINNYSLVYNKFGKDTSRGLFTLCLKTELRMTTNIREWRHILKLRGSFDHPQMLFLIRLIYDWFKKELPLFVEDINVK